MISQSSRVLASLALTVVVGLSGCSKSNDSSTNSSTGGGTHFDSGNIPGNGGMFSFVFTKVENVSYHCSIHPGMTGVISVSAASGSAVTRPVAMGPMAFIPNSLAVHVGDTVRWVNASGIAHTVTSDN